MKLTFCTALAVGVAAFSAVTRGGLRAEAADPCSLLTPAQVAAALSVPEVKASPAANRCMWIPAKYAPGSKSVTLQLETEKGFAAQRARPDVTPVTGIGDEAVQTSKIPVLTVKKGTVYFALSVHLPEDQAKAAEQSLAKQIVSKL
ncbi:MAG TPA: hypothetical protein VJN96_26995 [Vicinamibacterales bacterium]|nr:hypothetical protein [Vicinamibacterales bacterium]